MSKQVVYMKRFLGVILLFTIILQSCIKGEGPIIQDIIEVNGVIKGLKSKGDFDVVVIFGTDQTVIAEGYQNVIKNLNVNLNANGFLELELIQGNYVDLDLTIYVTISKGHYFSQTAKGDLTFINGENRILDSLEIRHDGSGDVRSIGSMICNGNAVLNLFGAGDINMKLNCSNFISNSNGAGDVIVDLNCNRADVFVSNLGNYYLTGNVNTQQVELNNSGYYRAFGLNSLTAIATNNGIGDIECKVANNLSANISSSGDILYKGTPGIIQNITGTGLLINSN